MSDTVRDFIEAVPHTEACVYAYHSGLDMCSCGRRTALDALDREREQARADAEDARRYRQMCDIARRKRGRGCACEFDDDGRALMTCVTHEDVAQARYLDGWRAGRKEAASEILERTPSAPSGAARGTA